MAGTSDRFKLTTFNTVGDSLDYRAWKFTGADRDLIDRLLTLAVERHQHTGQAPPTSQVPPAAPLATYSTTGGAIAGNTVLYYRSALVDERGQEGVASQTAVIYTPAPLSTPEPPTIAPTSGTLLAGSYQYAISAYSGDTTQETLISRTVAVLLRAPGGVSLTMPSPPSGATGFNMYRKGPTDSELRHLGTLTTATWLDTGTVAPDSLRGVPTANTTSSANTVSIAPPVVLSAGQSCRLYRSYNPDNWDDTLLAWTTTLPVVDTGHATMPGAPLAGPAATGSAPKIDLATETAGTLPPGRTPTSGQVTFSVQGLLTVGYSPWQWVNEYDTVVVNSLRATLGRGSSPAAQPVQVALELRRSGSTEWTRYQTSVTFLDITADIPPGDRSAVTAIDANSPAGITLSPGDALRPYVVQTGGGATPTDYDLAINVQITIAHGSAAHSYTWSTS